VTTFTAVKTTGIYCRSDCGASPLPTNTRPFQLAAAAEAAGYRACLRCRPYRTSQPAYWTGPEVVCKAVRVILGGGLDTVTEQDLAVRLGVSGRHLRRLFQTHLGITPTDLARSSRVHFARRLLDDTDLTVTEIAFATGFGSVRQLNRSCREIFHASPTELRARRRKADRLIADGGLAVRLPFDGPLDWDLMVDYFRARAIPGVEHVADGIYRRTVVVRGDPGVIEMLPGGVDHLVLRAHLPHWEGLVHLTQRARSIFGLDSGYEDGRRHLQSDPIIGPLTTAHPGIRVPGTWDTFETGVRAIVGQGITVAAATTIIGRLVAAHGTRVPGLGPMGLTHTFPTPTALASADLSSLGLPGIRQEAIRRFSTAVFADQIRLDGTADLDTLVVSISSIRGLGPWTANYLALRAGEPDAFPTTDLGLRRAYERLSDRSPTSLRSAAEAWRPWRALAAIHLWVGDTPEPGLALSSDLR
jgi:AraC family transcriptional regulator of adaptative response / DNA-3-methyladenine glycosylase II